MESACGYLCYGIAHGVEDAYSNTTHDQDFMARNRTEHMILGVVANTEGLPGG